MGTNELYEKAEFYLKNKVTVHIETNGGRYYNGLIIECSDKHIILLDRVLGETFLLLSEIAILEKYKEKKEGKAENGE